MKDATTKKEIIAFLMLKHLQERYCMEVREGSQNLKSTKVWSLTIKGGGRGVTQNQILIQI